MKGERNRGLAMGLNEFAGYMAVAMVAFLTGWVATNYGLRPYPFYIGIAISIIGLVISWFFVKDTSQHVLLESSHTKVPRLKHLFWETTWKNKNLGSVTQAGLVNNLNDGMVWYGMGIVTAFTFQQKFWPQRHRSNCSNVSNSVHDR